MAVRERMRRRLAAALAGTALVLAACTGHEVYIQDDVNSLAGFSTWVDTKPVYRIGPGDVMQVKYMLTPEMDEEVTVAPDGMVGLRTTGQIEVGGLTPKELELKVQAAARRYLTDPMVTVQVTKYVSSRIYVGGSVMAPGPYVIAGPLSTLEAIINAGGFRDEARPDEVVLIRRGPDGKPMLRTIDVQNFIQRLDPANDVKLVAGDIVFVPRSIAGEIGLWVEQYIDNIFPWDPNFQYVMNRDWSTSTGRTVPPL